MLFSEISFEIAKSCVIENPKKSKKFSCIICNNIALSAKSCEKCEALFCGKCLKAALQLNPKCPQCREAPFTQGKISRSFTENFKKLKILCPLDCGSSISHGEIESHFDIGCEKIPKIYICDLCGKKIKVDNFTNEEDLKEVKEHNKLYSQLISECEYCLNSFQVSLLHKHRFAFEDRKDKLCDKCGLYVLEPVRYLHESFYCGLLKDLECVVTK